VEKVAVERKAILKNDWQTISSQLLSTLEDANKQYEKMMQQSSDHWETEMKNSFYPLNFYFVKKLRTA
jgi:hypothetical protein